MLRQVTALNKCLNKAALPARSLSGGLLRPKSRGSIHCLIARRTNNSNYIVFRSQKYSILTTDGKEINTEIDNIDIDEYHNISSSYMESLFDNLEELSQDYIQLEVDYSDGVLNMELPPNGNYCINKQPPNKQIWLSSPISGPNRYDLVNGEWVSLRDGSKLTNVIEEEISKAIEKPFKFHFI